jgi:hypothetical protein
VLARYVSLWLVATIASAHWYVSSRIALPDAAPGYETSWDFQLFMFSLVRLPLFVAGLGILLWSTRTSWLKKG